MKRKKKNEGVDNIIYEQTGISQQALVQYIGANQSTLSRHLAGTRLLPGEAGLKLTNLTLKILKLPQQPLVQTLSTEEKRDLKRAADWCRTQCIPLQQQLAAMQEELAKAGRLLQFTEALEKEETDITEAAQRWYDNQRYTAQTRLEKYGRSEQLKLRVKIATLQKEAELYEAELGEA